MRRQEIGVNFVTGNGQCRLRSHRVSPLPGLARLGFGVSHPDRVGVGYGLASLRDFRREETGTPCFVTRSGSVAPSTFSQCEDEFPKNKFVCAALRNESPWEDLQKTGAQAVKVRARVRVRP